MSQTINLPDDAHLPDDTGTALEAKARERGVSPGEVVREGLRLLDQRERESQAKLEWLRAAAKEGFDQIARGEGIEFESMDDLAVYIDKIGEDVSSEAVHGNRNGCTA